MAQVTPAPIIVGIDFSGHGRIALDHAVQSAKRYGTGLVMVHAVRAERPAPVLLGGKQEARQQQVMEAVSELTELSNDWAAVARQAGVRVDVVADQGDPARLILEAARERKAALIVVGTQGRTGLVNALLGSVAERVIREAPCPVLVVPPPGPKP